MEMFVAATLKHGGGRIILWGCRRRFFRFDGKTEAAKYSTILGENLLTTGSLSIAPTCLNTVYVLTWPSQSQDLNTIENLL